jgi:hypothetical protein
VPGAEFLQLRELADGLQRDIARSRSGEGEALQVWQRLQMREPAAGELLRAKRRMEKGERFELLKLREVLPAVVGELDAITAEPFEFRESGEQRKRVVGDRFAADGEIFDRGELPSVLKSASVKASHFTCTCVTTPPVWVTLAPSFWSDSMSAAKVEAAERKRTQRRSFMIMGMNG